MKNWHSMEEMAAEAQSKKNSTLVKPVNNSSISFQRFEYCTSEKYGRKLAESREPMTFDRTSLIHN